MTFAIDLPFNFELLLTLISLIVCIFLNNDFFACLNILFFAITNGYMTGAFMVLTSESTADPKARELVGFIGGFGLTFGISCGTFVALAFAKANTW